MAHAASAPLKVCAPKGTTRDKAALPLPIPDPPSSVVWRLPPEKANTTETEVKGVTGVNVKEREALEAEP